MTLLSRRRLLTGLPLAVPAALTPALFAPALLAPNRAWSQPASSIPAAALIEPKELAAQLRAASGAPLLLHVGFKVLFERAHIPGSEYAGPARDAAGLKLLTDRVASLPHDRAIVLYCGCCPWSHCPNVAAAYQALTAAGLTHVKVLHIEDNFGTDWVDKGYPAQQA